jgi:hypothetical protein
MWEHGQMLGKLFNKMPSQDVVSWTAILGGCAMHGHDKDVLKHFKWMCGEGVQPDEMTFVTFLLSACSHAGSVDEGMRCYASTITVYMISAKLEHYSCMVDLLDCASNLQEAENTVMECPVNQMWLHGWLCSVLAEFMVMWRWQNVL